ncbi:Ankyrin repeat domain-containing protein 16, partial [Araneus ventricosus]
YYAEQGNKVILEHKNLDGKTPLHIAAHSSQLECVKYFLSYGVSVNPLKRSDWTPLMLACTKTNLDIIKELVVHGADINIANKDGWTAFHIASREGDVNIIQYLLEVNPLVWNTKSKNGRTPLHTACLHGHLEVVKIFLESASYDINVKDSCGITPVMDAVSGIHNQVVEFLVEKGVMNTFLFVAFKYLLYWCVGCICFPHEQGWPKRCVDGSHQMLINAYSFKKFKINLLISL